MPHRITFLPQNRTTRTPDGASILDASAWAGLPIESVCGGQGVCGQCRVRILEGAGPVSPGDARFLSRAQLDAGWRLACRAPVHADCLVELPRLADTPRAAPLGHGRLVELNPNVRKVYLQLQPPVDDGSSDMGRATAALRTEGYEVRVVPSVWRALPWLLRQAHFCVTAVICGDGWIAVEPGDTTDRNFGLALDIGTTTVAAGLVDLHTGSVVAAKSLLNGQAVYGADVISRISYASTGGLADLQRRVVATLNQLVDGALAQSSIVPEEVYEVVAVGNAVMLHLLLGVDPAPMGVSPFTLPFRGPVTVPAAGVGLRLHPEARLTTLPHIGAYVGADVVAGVLATELLRRTDGEARLYLDIGTNSEIVLVKGERCLCAAAPAGPAFEGAQIRCGMRAAEGAIESVRIGDDVRLGVVGGGSRPAGICGSGLIDAIAELLRCGLLDQSGRFVRPDTLRGPLPSAVAGRFHYQDGGPAFWLSSPEDGIALTQADVREVQLAKAAIAAGTQTLLDRMGVWQKDLQEVLLAGAFGSYLRPASARAIGLVPEVPLERIVAVGNAAGDGAPRARVAGRTGGGPANALLRGVRRALRNSGVRRDLCRVAGTFLSQGRLWWPFGLLKTIFSAIELCNLESCSRLLTFRIRGVYIILDCNKLVSDLLEEG